MRAILFILFYFSIQIVLSQTLIDSYNESNYGADRSVYSGSTYQYIGQSFTNTSALTLHSCKFYLKKSGSPTGNIYAYIYAHTGTYGANSLPSGAALATSNAYDVSTLTTSSGLITFTFSGLNQISLSASTYYVVIFSYGGGNSSNYVAFGHDSTAPTHGGNYCYSSNGSSWFSAARDAVFYVYGTSSSSISKVAGVSLSAIGIVGGVAAASILKIAQVTK